MNLWVEEVRRYPVERSTEPVKLTIQPLPTVDQPEDYTGAVGKYTMDVLAKPTKVKIGDPITLSINIKWRGKYSDNRRTITRSRWHG